jgi:hypothetical protein
MMKFNVAVTILPRWERRLSQSHRLAGGHRWQIPARTDTF